MKLRMQTGKEKAQKKAASWRRYPDEVTRIGMMEWTPCPNGHDSGNPESWLRPRLPGKEERNGGRNESRTSGKK